MTNGISDGDGKVSSRVTIRDVRGAFTRAEIAARAVGLDTNSWYLIPSSRTSGEGWRLFTRPGAGTAITGLDRGFLGMTAREAHHALIMMAIAWETVTDLADYRRSAMLGDLGELNSG